MSDNVSVTAKKVVYQKATAVSLQSFFNITCTRRYEVCMDVGSITKPAGTQIDFIVRGVNDD